MKFLSLLSVLLLASCSEIRSNILNRESTQKTSVGTNNPNYIGVSVLYDQLKQDEVYEKTILRNFTSITPENALKFEVIHPNETTTDYSEANYIVRWANQNNILVRGHPIIWHRQVPLWLKEKSTDSAKFQDIFDSHILNLVSYYKDSIQIWDVINEAFNSDGSLRKSIWLKNLGPEYIKNAFILAHLANPKAKLFYNDYDISKPGPKSKAVYKLLKGLLALKIPIHGIGFQMHLRPDFMPTEQEIMDTFKKLADLGLEINITELDIAIPTPSTEKERELQKQNFEMVFRVCNKTKACKLLSLWGLHDGVSWIPNHFKGLGEATLFNREMKLKESYEDFIMSLHKSH